MIRIKSLSSKTKIVILIICTILIIGAGVGINYYLDYIDYKDKVEAIQIPDTNFGDVSDGKYFGEYDSGMVGAKVNVSVKDGRVESIDLLEHKNDRGKPAEAIINTIIEKQNVNVDTITGATSSSQVIKQAVYNAISEGK